MHGPFFTACQGIKLPSHQVSTCKCITCEELPVIFLSFVTSLLSSAFDPSFIFQENWNVSLWHWQQGFKGQKDALL